MNTKQAKENLLVLDRLLNVASKNKALSDDDTKWAAEEWKNLYHAANKK